MTMELRWLSNDGIVVVACRDVQALVAYQMRWLNVREHAGVIEAVPSRSRPA